MSNIANKNIEPVKKENIKKETTKLIRIVENGEEKEITNMGVKKIKLDRLIDSRELERIIRDKLK